MKFKSLLPLVVLIGAGSLALSGCTSSGDPGGNVSPSSDANARHSISVGVIPVAEFQTVYIAQDEGFFDELGLDVTIEVQSNAASIVPSVMNGQLTFGTSATPPFLVATEKNLPLRAIANAANTAAVAEDDTGAIVVAADSNIKTLGDLEGKTLATNALGSLPHVAAAARLSDAGVDLSKVEFVAMPFPDMQGALEQGRVDALLTVEPFMTKTLEAGATFISPLYAGVYPAGTTHTLFFTSEEYVDKNPEVVKKFQQAIAKANDLVTQDDSYLRNVLVKYGKMDEAVAQAVKLPVYDTSFNIPGIEVMADLMVKTGFLAEKPDLATYFIQ